MRKFSLLTLLTETCRNVESYGNYLRPGLNPRPWVPEASMLTTRPPKPSEVCLYVLKIRFV
jgi:hypothetical protein